MDQDNRIDDLIAKLKAGTLTDEELADLTDWYNSFDDTQITLPTTGEDTVEELKARMYQRLMKQIKPGSHATRTRTMRWLPYTAAAILAVAGMWYVIRNTTNDPAAVEVTAEDIVPGGNRAMLTLADGRTVSLSEAQSGIMVGDGITYFDGSSVIGEQGDSRLNPADSGLQSHAHNRSLMLSTPRGGTYQIALPDGTLVWLNSSSMLKYPSRFDGPERVVELAGEAYFDVSKQQKKPFKVISDGQVVEVLGTQFNIAAYSDEPRTRTTLVTGSVRVVPSTDAGSPITIMPGQQSIIMDGDVQVAAVDTNQYIAWKQGFFYFDATPLEEMLKQIERWYDVKVVYKRGIPNETFTGKFRRDVSLKGAINILRLSLIDAKLSNRTLIIN